MFDQIAIDPKVMDVLEFVLNAGVLVLPLLVFFVLTALGGEATVYRFKRFLLAFRAMVDEPSDLLIIWYAKQTGQNPKELSDEIKAKLDDFMKNFPGVVVEGQVIASDIPPQETMPLPERVKG